jgi:hypothetical protein
MAPPQVDGDRILDMYFAGGILSKWMSDKVGRCESTNPNIASLYVSPSFRMPSATTVEADKRQASIPITRPYFLAVSGLSSCLVRKLALQKRRGMHCRLGRPGENKSWVPEEETAYSVDEERTIGLYGIWARRSGGGGPRGRCGPRRRRSRRGSR